MPSLGICQQRFISVEGIKVHVNTMGIEDREEGQPVVVFESGHGMPLGNWDKVLDGVAEAELAPVVTYDRAGVGESEPDDQMPTIKHVANRLVSILKALELEPPYVLVGHSLGGIYVRGFAVYYPDLLAGLVIVDPGDFTETKDNIRDYYEVLDWEDSQVDSLINYFIEIRRQRSGDSPASIRNESTVLEDLRDSDFQELSSPLPNIPVHILVGGRFDMPARFRSDAYDDEALFRSKIKHRVARWTDVIQSVDRGMLLYSGDAGHFVQWDDPELVISSIRIVLQDYTAMKEGK